jgi:hypothetical protein
VTEHWILQGGGVVASIQEASERDMDYIAEAANRRVSCRLQRFNSSHFRQQCAQKVDLQEGGHKEEAKGDCATLPWWQRVAQHVVSSPVRIH